MLLNEQIFFIQIEDPVIGMKKVYFLKSLSNAEELYFIHFRTFSTKD